MAKNLRVKMPAGDTLVVNDVNAEAPKRLAQETSQGVEIADNVLDVARRAVRIFYVVLSRFTD